MSRIAPRAVVAVRSFVRALFALAFVCVAAAPPTLAQQVDFTRLAETYLAKHPVPGKARDELKIEDVVEQHFAPARIGAIDLRFPRSFLTNKAALDSFKEVVASILQTHAAWLEVVGAHGEVADGVRGDVTEVLKWLKGAKLASGGDKAADFLGAFTGGASLAPQLQRIAEGFRSGAALGFTPRGGKLQVLVVSPTREDFAQLAGLVGLLEPDSRGVNWNDSILGWTEFGWNDLQVVALQYPPLTPGPENLGEGVRMNLRESTGLSQHVAQRCAVQLCWHSFDKLLDSALEMALAQALVVDLYSENNTRSGGVSRGNSVDGITAFIPGGRSEGGALPPTNADSGWRTTLGKDHFVKPLRASQKLGAKAATNKAEQHAYFQLLSDDTSKRFAVRAPFFGTPARSTAAPEEEFMRDYQEFFRAYKTAFAHWLRNKSHKTVKDSRERFAALLRKVAEVGSAATFEELVQEVYGIPLSAQDMAVDSLEGHFLEWLASNAS